MPSPPEGGVTSTTTLLSSAQAAHIVSANRCEDTRTRQRQCKFSLSAINCKQNQIYIVCTYIAGHNFCRFMQRFSQQPPKRQPTDNLVSFIEPAWRHHHHRHLVESLHKYARHFWYKMLRNVSSNNTRRAHTLLYTQCKGRSISAAVITVV